MSAFPAVFGVDGLPPAASVACWLWTDAARTAMENPTQPVNSTFRIRDPMLLSSESRPFVVKRSVLRLWQMVE
jgi:hypothetical protein